MSLFNFFLYPLKPKQALQRFALTQNPKEILKGLRSKPFKISFVSLKAETGCNWAQEQPRPRGAAIACNGKNQRNTVSNGDNDKQNFISMVSLFSQEQGAIVATAIMENKKESEICVI